MKNTLLFVGLCMIGMSAAAESSVSISGALKVAVARGNGGTTPLDANNADGWAVHDESSSMSFSGKEDLGDGLYAGFTLTTFANIDTGTIGGGGSMWSAKSVVRLGGKFGEFYLGRALTPASFMVLFADPWYWDGSAAQIGWQIQQANYLSTAFLRTNNTIGYNSPDLNGFTVSLAASPGEGTTSRDIGGSANYKKGPIWVGIGYDQSNGFANHATKDHMATIAGGYDFGVVRPLASFTSSKVNGVTYKAFSIAATAPAGELGLVKVAYSHLDDFDTTTVAKEALRRMSLGYQYNLSKRTNLFVDITQAKAQTRSANNHVQFGIEHSF
jgi:predicted porin